MFHRDDDGAVFLHEAWDADRASFADFGECRVIVSEDKEFLQAACLLSDVDDFIIRIFSVELLGLSAVRAAFHYIYLYHDALFFY